MFLKKGTKSFPGPFLILNLTFNRYLFTRKIK